MEQCSLPLALMPHIQVSSYLAVASVTGQRIAILRLAMVTEACATQEFASPSLNKHVQTATHGHRRHLAPCSMAMRIACHHRWP